MYAMQFFLSYLMHRCFVKKTVQSEAMYFFLHPDVNEKLQYEYKTQWLFKFLNYSNYDQ